MNIRGAEVSTGDVCFLYQPTSSDFRFGNIEEFLGDSVRVSFPADDWDRRGSAETFNIDEIILAHEMSQNVSPGQGNFVASEVLVREGGTGVCTAYAVLATQEDNSHPIVAIRVGLEDDGKTWTAQGPPELLQLSKVYRPTNLARMLRYIYCSPVHPLFDVLRQRVGLDLEYEGPATLQLGDVGVPVIAAIKVDGHRIAVHLDTHYQVVSALLGVRQTFEREELLPPEQQAPSWLLSVAWNGASQHSEAAKFVGAIDVIPRSLTVDHRPGLAIATTALYVGAPIRIWSDLVWYREAPINPVILIMAKGPIPNAIFLKCFDRSAIIHIPRSHGEDDNAYVAITYLGEPLGREESSVLSSWIGFITGGRASNVATETFSLDHKLRTVIHDRGNATLRKRPPIPIDKPTHYARFITKSLPTVLEEFARWYAVDPNSFDAIFHHYAEAVDSSYPVTTTLRLTIALEAFINLVTQDKKENEKIVSTESFVPFRDAMIANATAYQAANDVSLDVEALTRFVRKLNDLNSGSNTKRIKRFWELIDIDVSPEDQALLRRLRNASVHNGFLVNEDGEQDVLGSANDAARLCNVFNRAVLHYAKYTGPVRSALDGKWLEPKSGSIYHVPAVPSAGMIEIRHTVSAPAMTPEEQAAVDALSQVRHSVDAFEEYFVDETLSLED